jgi:hypothetical protein
MKNRFEKDSERPGMADTTQVTHSPVVMARGGIIFVPSPDKPTPRRFNEKWRWRLQRRQQNHSFERNSYT